MKNQKSKIKNQKSKSNMLAAITFLLLTFFSVSCSHFEKTKTTKDVVKQKNSMTTNSENEIETLICTSKNSLGQLVTLTIVRNIADGFTTVHKEISQASPTDVPTLYFDGTLSDAYTENSNGIQLNIPNDATYFFIPFQPDENNDESAKVIEGFKDFTCTCCEPESIENSATPLCKKVIGHLNGLKSFGCATFQNCVSCGFNPNGVLNVQGVILKANQIVYN
jgi:hypothetical protein